MGLFEVLAVMCIIPLLGCGGGFKHFTLWWVGPIFAFIALGMVAFLLTSGLRRDEASANLLDKEARSLVSSAVAGYVTTTLLAPHQRLPDGGILPLVGAPSRVAELDEVIAQALKSQSMLQAEAARLRKNYRETVNSSKAAQYAVWVHQLNPAPIIYKEEEVKIISPCLPSPNLIGHC